ncbi:MAG: ABC transporter substrate-binding protein [Sphingomonas sp.]|nr:ABC transporter substrate-binding protein [Sphingomonas sp.]
MLVASGGCDRRPDDVAVTVSVIGGTAKLADPTRGPLDPAERLTADAIAQGLVRFDANGGIEPGLAERWIVIDGGRSYIFRLEDASWPDGTRIRARDVVDSLRRTVAAQSRVTLSPFLAVIDEIVEMTPQVVEVRLKQPRPDLLKLFAQPEMAILRRPVLAGTGPLRVARSMAGELLLRPPVNADPDDDEPAEVQGEADTVRLRGERAALAVARFAARRSDLLLGGTFRDWPLLAHADVAPANVRVDPAAGLFGLAIVSREGFLSARENRAALAMAIDRATLTALFRPDWQPVETMLPARLDSSRDPTPPAWQSLDLDARRIAARNRVAIYHAANPDTPLTIRVALTRSPGVVLLWSRIASDLRDIGLLPVWVDEDADADLRIVDAVAPYDSGRWYLVTACGLCAEPVMAAITAARDAPSLPERASRIAAAELAMAQDTPYIPIAQPLRWSLVALRLEAWQGNSRAWHPLTHLRRPGR